MHWDIIITIIACSYAMIWCHVKLENMSERYLKNRDQKLFEKLDEIYWAIK